ncbi:MAG TPA: histidine kinase [Kofleriaceae bacterium]|nr:histidine kinase [Kofleriaceae bacterium]
MVPFITFGAARRRRVLPWGELIVDDRHARRYWTCQLAGWFIYDALWLLPGFSTGETIVPVGRVLLGCVIQSVIAIAWTHLYRHVIRKRGWVALGPGKLLPRVVAACVVVGVAMSVSCIPLGYLYGPAGRPLRVWLPFAIPALAFSVSLWSGIYFGVHYFDRWRRAERDKAELAVAAAEAKLHSLMSQLNPHFLFNCLNSVRALIVEDPARAHTAVTALSNLIRYSLQATHVATVPLSAEIDMVKTYLVLEGIRFEERLRCEIDMAADTRAVPVPPMLVQSLVENGVKHGIERLPEGGTIEVASWLDGDALCVRVRNSGRIVERPGSTRVGLRNARERLRLLYGERASVAMREDGASVVADLSVPVRGASA